MPSVKPKESKESYLGRAIPEMIKEGLTNKQAVGKAMGMYKSNWKGPKKGFRKALDNHGK